MEDNYFRFACNLYHIMSHTLRPCLDYFDLRNKHVLFDFENNPG